MTPETKAARKALRIIKEEASAPILIGSKSLPAFKLKESLVAKLSDGTVVMVDGRSYSLLDS